MRFILQKKTVESVPVALFECDKYDATRWYKGNRWQLVAVDCNLNIGFDRKTQALAAFNRVDKNVIAGLLRAIMLEKEAKDHYDKLYNLIYGGKLVQKAAVRRKK